MKIKLVVFSILLSGIVIYTGFASESGKTGMSFLKVGIGARPGGMGEAYSAVVDNALAAYWNPAGLASAEGSNATLVFNSWLLDVRSEFGAIQFKKHFALSIYNFHVGDIQVRTIPSEHPLETTSAQYLSFGATYARSLSQNLDGGVTLKYLYEKIHVHAASGFAVDLGVRYKLKEKNLYFAATIQNIGKMGKFENESTKLPLISRLGTMYKVPKEIGPMTLLFAVDLVKPLNENWRFNSGTEIAFWKQVIIRGGYMGGYETRNVTFGLGVRKSSFHFDYSVTPLSDGLETAHHFSVDIKL